MPSDSNHRLLGHGSRSAGPIDLDHAIAGLGHKSTISGRNRRDKQSIAARLFGDEPEPEPERIGRFRILHSIGRGGMGEVLAARDEELDRLVAIKVMRRRRSASDAERFLREGRALAKLSHANIVQIHEVGEHEGLMFIAMEHVAGQTLGAWLREADEPRPWREVVRVFCDAGRGLAAAHELGLVHRDFKPDNVMIGRDGRVRVLDFGLVRAVDRPPPLDDRETQPERRDADSSPELRITETGVVIGTPAYMAPEQHRAETATPASDQFSFCVALYEGLNGIRPFVATTQRELMRAIAAGELAPRRRGIPARVHRAVTRGLAADPDKRWPGMNELLAALDHAVRPRRAWWLAPALVLGGVAGFGVLQQRELDQRCAGAEAELAGVWDADARARVEAAFGASERPYAAATWARLAPILDGYAAAWVAGHRDACEAARIREVQSLAALDLRMSCLAGRRTELDAVVDVLASGAPGSLDHAIDLAVGLPSLDRCADLEALGADLPPPDDPAVAVEVEDARARLARARIRLEAGQITEVGAEITGLKRSANLSEYPPLQTEVGLFEGAWLDAAARYPEAEARLEETLLAATEQGHELVAAEAAQHLATVVGQRQAKLDAGLIWGKTALALARRPNASVDEHARALTALAAVEARREDIGAALDHYRLALRLREDAFGPDDLRVGESAGNYARMLHGLERRPEILTYARLPRAATSRLEPAQVQSLNVRRKLEAVELLERSLAIFEAKLGPEHPRLIPELTSLAQILVELDELDQAGEIHTRALDLAERTLPDQHPDLAAALLGWGALVHARGQPELALASYQRALAILDASLAPDNPAIATALVYACMAWVELGRLDEARPACARALDLREAAFGPDQLLVATPATMLGLALVRAPEASAEQRERGRALLSRGRALFGRHLGGGHRANLVPLVELAEQSLAAGEIEEARDLAFTILSSVELNVGEETCLGCARFLRARALAAGPGFEDIARELAERAETELRLDGRYPAELAAVRAWLAARPG